jgi:hypothetical protein
MTTVDDEVGPHRGPFDRAAADRAVHAQEMRRRERVAAYLVLDSVTGVDDEVQILRCRGRNLVELRIAHGNGTGHRDIFCDNQSAAGG